MEVPRCVVFLAVIGLAFANTDVREPPDIKPPDQSEIPDVYFKVHSSLTLPCVATGIPRPKYTWNKDGMVINVSSQYVRKLKDGNIEIRSAWSQDEGDYRCIAYNKWGRSLSQIFRLRLADIGPFQNGENVSTYEHRIGEHLVIERDDITSKPKPSYTWLVATGLNGQHSYKLNRSRRIIQDLDGNLHFTSLLPEDSLEGTGIYRLEALNGVLGTSSYGCNSRVTLKPKEKTSEGSPLLIYHSNTVVDALEGSEVKLQCIFVGSHDIEVVWIAPINKYITTESGTVLVVSSMTSEDEGKYTCVGRNQYGNNTADIKLQMTAPPKFLDGGKPTKQILSEQDTARFWCQTRMDKRSPVTIEWMVNGQPLSSAPPSYKHRLEISDIRNGKQLLIPLLTRDEDNCVIQCKVQNEHGTIHANAVLVVLLRTRLTLKPKNQILRPETTSVTFTCHATSDPSTDIMINWLRDGKPTSQYKDQRLLGGVASLSLDLKGLSEDETSKYSGVYSCNASNGYTFAFHNAILSFSTSDGSPINTSLLVGASAGWTVILIVAIGIGILCVRRRRRRMSQCVKMNVLRHVPERHQLLEVPHPSAHRLSDQQASPPAIYINCPEDKYEVIDPRDIQTPTSDTVPAEKKEEDNYIDQSEVEPRRKEVTSKRVYRKKAQPCKQDEETKDSDEVAHDYLVMVDDNPQTDESDYLKPRQHGFYQNVVPRVNKK